MSDSSDPWRSTASLATLKLRAKMLARVRAFFAERGVLEVETPILSAAGATEPNIHSFAAHSLAPGDTTRPGYLHTSPEFAMKRLLASGSGSIFQLCHVFRAGESGRRHNQEFTMLEWYRVGVDVQQLMKEVADLATEALSEYRTLEAPELLSYKEAFLRFTGLDPHTANTSEFAATAARFSIDIVGLAAEDLDGWRDLLLTHLVEPKLGRGRLSFIYDYPASQAALARIRHGDPPLAERFELYLEGIELANGFHELADKTEQRSRFESERQIRSERNLPDIQHDERFLAALEHGLPDCSGVALGFDRLVMLAAGVNSIAEAITFPTERA